MNIFCDMDGTLTQYNYQDYDNNLWQLHPEVLCKEPVVTSIPKEVIILTKVTTPEEAILKQEWASKYFPNNIFLTTYEPKYLVVDPTNSILISDYNKELEEWREHGGIPVKLINNVNSPRDDMTCIPQPISFKTSMVEQDDGSMSLCIDLRTDHSEECYKLEV